MELNISELDNVNTMNPYETFNVNSYQQQQGDNYWTKTNTQQQKKKKVTFNDILSNMNLVVNKNGALQFMNMKQEEPQVPQYQPQQHYQPQQQYQNQEQYQQQQYQQQYNNEPLDPSVTHSYIYNKYFKDYSDPNVEKQGPRVPKTIEEYHQMLLDDRIAAIKHKQHVDKVKSRKMFFTSVPGSHSNPRKIVASTNNLRSMKFG